MGKIEVSTGNLKRGMGIVRIFVTIQSPILYIKDK